MDILDGIVDDNITIEEIERETGWPPDYISTKGMIPYIKRMGSDLIGLEIGTGRGDSAYHLLTTCPNIKKLTTVDPYKAYDDWNGPISKDHQEKSKELAIANLAKFGDRVDMCEKLDVSEGPVFDFIYIDGDHSLPGVTQDLEEYYDVLKPGGLIAVHDCNLGSVNEAIRQFRRKRRINMPLHNSSNGLAFWYRYKDVSHAGT
tara:strand:- start:333 stop:941 length:609 start_codon:yes stop_codon:yes gene_type:complete